MADNLLREVDEALRADRAAMFWQKHRGAVILFVLALVLGTAANSGWQKYREAEGGKTLAQFAEGEKLMADGKAADAAAKFEAIAGASSGEQRDLAHIWQARALVAAGKKDEAAAALKTAAAGNGLWADIACLRLAGIDAKEATPCLGAATKSPLAGERAQWAAANQWANGEQDAAIASIEKLVLDDATSQDSRAQLNQWLATMKAQQGKK